MYFRSEEPTDYEQIGALHCTTFGHTLEKELIQGLRQETNYRPEFSIVGDEAGRVIAHAMLTPVEIVNNYASHPAMVIGPVSVHPDFQGLRIGAGLVEEGIRRCRALGVNILLVCGADYYKRFGFTMADDYHIYRPNPLVGEHFQILELTEGAAKDVHGVVRYPRPFLPTLNRWYT